MKTFLTVHCVLMAMNQIWNPLLAKDTLTLLAFQPSRVVLLQRNSELFHRQAAEPRQRNAMRSENVSDATTMIYCLC